MAREKYVYSGEVAREALRKRARELRSETEIALILDLDETIANTVQYWNRLLNRWMRMYRGKRDEELPTFEQLQELGGTDGAYRDSDLFASREEYEAVMEMLRRKAGPNVQPLPMEDGISEKISTLLVDGSLKVELLGSVTARPGTQSPMEATQKQLFGKYGLTNFPVLGRPESVKISETSGWKIRELVEIAKLMTEKTVVIVDDSASLAGAIRSYNQDRATGDPFLVQIVYPGPLTLARINNLDETKKLKEDKEHGIFISNGWGTMGQTILEVKEWVKSIQNQQ